MPKLMYRCPRTSVNVDIWLADEVTPVSADTYEHVMCPSCAHIHFNNKTTAKRWVIRASRQFGRFCIARLFEVNSPLFRWDRFAFAFYRAAVPYAPFRCCAWDPERPPSFSGSRLLLCRIGMHGSADRQLRQRGRVSVLRPTLKLGGS
jgi:hypothetical protein